MIYGLKSDMFAYCLIEISLDTLRLFEITYFWHLWTNYISVDLYHFYITDGIIMGCGATDVIIQNYSNIMISIVLTCQPGLVFSQYKNNGASMSGYKLKWEWNYVKNWNGIGIFR